MSLDLYDILGVDPDADQAAIKRAFRRQARRYHPDRNPSDPEAGRKFKRLAAAFEILSDPARRRRWDRYGVEGVDLPASLEGEVDRASNSERGGVGGTFEDIFDGRSPFDTSHMKDFGGFETTSRSEGAPRDGEDVVRELCVDFTDAVVGREVAVEIDGEPAGLPLRPGTESGDRIRIEGSGDPARDPGGNPGDLVFEIQVRSHPRMEREGRDLTMTVPITIGEAVRGATIEVPTPHGTVNMEVPSGVDSGVRLRLEGYGVRTEEGEGRGDLFVCVQIVVPDRVDADVEEAADRIDSAYSYEVRGDFGE